MRWSFQVIQWVYHKLPSNLKSFSLDYVRPICVLLNAKMENVLQFNVTGWGWRENGEMSRVLQKATLSKFDRSQCSQKYKSTVDETQICAGSYSSDCCNGDSGGPLSAEVYYQGEFRPFQYGIVSYGKHQCTGGGLGVYTNVTSFTYWIMDAMLHNS